MVARPCVEHLLRSTLSPGDTDDEARHADADTQYTDGIVGACECRVRSSITVEPDGGPGRSVYR